MVEEPHVFDPLQVGWRPTTSGTSLFHRIPERNCSSAGIPGKWAIFINTDFETISSWTVEKFCPCSRAVSVDITSPIVKHLALTSIDFINHVKLKNHSKLCAVLSLKSIIRAEAENSFVSDQMLNLSTQVNYTHSYTVLFEASPSDAIFESQLLYDEKTNASRVRNQILRINLYGQTSACIKDIYELRSFCYCLSHHKTLHKTPTKVKALPTIQRASIKSTKSTRTTQPALSNSTTTTTKIIVTKKWPRSRMYWLFFFLLISNRGRLRRCYFFL